METLRSGVPDRLSLTSQMLWPSADILAWATPSVDSPGAGSYHHTTSPSVSKMKGISAFVPFQNEATKKPLASLAASLTEKLAIGLAVFFAPVASRRSSLAYVVVPSLA